MSCALALVGEAGQASMGPPSEDGGYVAKVALARRVGIRFNGAAVRGRRIWTVIGRLSAYGKGFNGAAVRGRRISSSAVILPAATSLLQWGRRPRTADIDEIEIHATDALTASMGPPSEDGGYTAASLPSRIFRRGFNGAAVRGRRIFVVDVPAMGSAYAASMGPPSEDGGYAQVGAVAVDGPWLQWGRRPRTADIAWLTGRAPTYIVASMGPPSEDGGYVVFVPITQE